MAYAAGIAQATGTRLDSAAKHTMACKLDDNMHVSWFESGNARLHIQNNKYMYAMQKDELVLNVSQRLNTPKGYAPSGAKAYPAVVTSMGSMSPAIKEGLRRLYASPTGPEFLRNRDARIALDGMADDNSEADKKRKAVLKRIWSAMPFFTAQGYALGTAWASAYSGDTVGTVLVGGMVTVRNGAFSCRAGQPMMFYFDFEVDEFSKTSTDQKYEGERLSAEGTLLDDASVARQAERGDLSDPNEGRKRARALEYDSYGGGSQKTGIALPKPYVLFGGRDHYGDRIRIFAKCINGGRPHDMVDLMLMTQSL